MNRLEGLHERLEERTVLLICGDVHHPLTEVSRYPNHNFKQLNLNLQWETSDQRVGRVLRINNNNGDDISDHSSN